MTIVLASASPRRKELLARIVDEFLIVPSRREEPVEGKPRERVVHAASAKARDIAERHVGVIIGADTLVILGKEVLGKPRSRDEARRMLEALSGREHAVVTGLCVLSTWTGAETRAAEETVVRFRDLESDEIERYLDTGEGDDKAGAYAIQGRAGAFVDRIAGDYYNVMGLPLCRLVLMLREVGVRV